MNQKTVYVALQQFCETDTRPRRLLLDAGYEVHENRLGRRLQREEMYDVLRGADAVLAGVEPYDATLLVSLPRLRCISRCGVGTDNIDLEAARQRQIAVFRTEEEVAAPVAELAVAMMLALARNLPLHAHEVRQGAWKKRTGFLLSEWTIGVVGFGRIGRAVERILRAFGPRLLVADPAVTAAELPEGVGFASLSQLLAESDLVSVHADRRREDGSLIGARELAMMKPGAFLVNTARGHLVDEQALLAALEAGRLAGAALDVFETEPYAGPFATLPQVLCTPHVATLTRASRAAMELRAAQQIVEHGSRQPTAVEAGQDR